MIKKIKQMFLSAMALSLFAAPLAMVPVANAATSNLNGSLCAGTKISLGNPDDTCKTGNEGQTAVNGAVKLGLNLFSAIVGIIAVVMIIVAGIQYITSSGDSGKATNARNTILYAVIGLVVVALAQIIVKFVLERFVSGTVE